MLSNIAAWHLFSVSYMPHTRDNHFVVRLFAGLMACGCVCCCRLVAINCLMELVIASAAVAKGFSDYLASLIWSLDNAGPHLLTHWNGKFTLSSTGANGVALTIDLVAMAAVLIIMMLLVIGVKVSKAVNRQAGLFT